MFFLMLTIAIWDGSAMRSPAAFGGCQRRVRKVWHHSRHCSPQASSHRQNSTWESLHKVRDLKAIQGFISTGSPLCNCCCLAFAHLNQVQKIVRFALIFDTLVDWSCRSGQFCSIWPISNTAHRVTLHNMLAFCAMWIIWQITISPASNVKLCCHSAGSQRQKKQMQQKQCSMAESLMGILSLQRRLPKKNLTGQMLVSGQEHMTFPQLLTDCLKVSSKDSLALTERAPSVNSEHSLASLPETNQERAQC